MPSGKLLLGGAATAALGVRMARSLYDHWRTLPAAERERIAPLAERAKERALALRGEADRARAEADLRAANASLAEALVKTAEADPEVGREEVAELREDLQRELDRLADADVKASRTQHERASARE
jgi:hypothetical protein